MTSDELEILINRAICYFVKSAPSRPHACEDIQRFLQIGALCGAVTIVRTRPLSRATVGNAMPWANTPPQQSIRELHRARASPTITA